MVAQRLVTFSLCLRGEILIGPSLGQLGLRMDVWFGVLFQDKGSDDGQRSPVLPAPWTDLHGRIIVDNIY